MKWRDVLRWLAQGLLPMTGDGEESDGEPADAEAAVEEADGEPAVEDDPLATLREENRKLKEAQEQRDRSVREEAESLIQEMLPELDEERGAPAGGYDMPGDQGDEDELTEDQRISRLEQQQQQQRLNQESERLVNYLNHLKGSKFPYLDIGRTLTILANSGNRPMNIERLAGLVNDSVRDTHEHYHQERLKDESHRAELLEQWNASPAEPVGEQPPPPRIPRKGSGGAPAGGEPITRQNASKVFAERLRKAGWGR